MDDTVTRILADIDSGDPRAAAALLPAVYDQLRKLAERKLAAERAGQTLQATALVHEAYLRLVGSQTDQQFNGRGHFFAAAAEAMRRILVDAARRRNRLKRGGGGSPQELNCSTLLSPDKTSEVGDEELLDLDASLAQLEREDEESARLVKLRYFAGLTIPEAAAEMGISPRKADQLWSFARAWLRRQMTPE
jgi:RNA polymerase sigma factor (TIGR02999 family)